MSPPTDLLEIVESPSDICERLRVPYSLGGAIAQNFWGTVRATADVDVLVAVPRIRFEELRCALDEAGFRSFDRAEGLVPLSVATMVAEERERHLITVHRGLVKVEVFFPFLPLQHSILRRAVLRRLGRREVPITTAEDLIPRKRPA